MSIHRIFISAAVAAGLAAILPRAARAEEGRFIVENFSSRETDSGTLGWTSIQDENGVMYFGCDDVVTFDGSHWTKYPVPGSYSVRSMALGKGGRLWIGASNELGYFDRTDKGLSAYHSLIAELPPEARNYGDTWHTFATDDGAVFTTSNSVLSFDGKHFKVFPMPGGRRIVAIRTDDEILLEHLPSGLWSFKGGEIQMKIPASVLMGAGVIWAGRTPAGLILATNRGFYTYESGKLSLVPGEGSAFLNNKVLSFGARSPKGDIYVATVNNGIGVFDASGNFKRTISVEEGLPTHEIYSLFFAQDGALWATSGVGISRVDVDAGATLFDSREGLTGKTSLSMIQNGPYLLDATDDGLFRIATGIDRTSRFEPVSGLGERFLQLENSADGSVIAAGYKHVTLINGGEFHDLFTASSDVEFAHESAQSPGNFIIFSGYDLERVEASGTDTFKTTIIAHPEDAPETMIEDAAGNIWLGTHTRGAFLLPNPFKKPGALMRLHSPGDVTNTGRVNVALVGNAVAVFTPKNVETFSSMSEPRDIASVVPGTAEQAVSNRDAEGAVWVAFESQFPDGLRSPIVGRLNVGPEGASTWQPYVIPGLAQLGEVESIFVDNRGIIWMGGSEGLLRLEPGELRPWTSPGAPLIRSSVARDERLPANQNAASFSYSGLQFGGQETYRYETKLTGGAGAWSQPTTDDHLNLASLRNGSYEFSVRVVNGAGMAGPPSTWSFVVLPPWYSTLPALLGFGVALAAIVFGGFQWRLAYLRRRNAKLEILVKKKTEQLVRANDAKSEFLANMSHEIRNPISGILGLSLAFEETTMDKRQRYLADSINSCATLLATLVDDVLDFSKIEAGTIELRSAPFSLRIILEQCVSMVAENAKATGSTVTVTFGEKLPAQLVGDAGRVQQILLNFLTNALKFGNGKPVEIGATAGFHDRVRFFVRDRGAGMTEAEAATLFTKFNRLESARTGNIRGTGLGLAVCRLLAGKMGGRVGVDSEPGSGSCFWAEIPFLTVSEAPGGIEVRSSGAPALKALIVEDIDYNVVAMQAVLRKLDIRSDVVNDGFAALAKLQTIYYDVAFLDWNLPGLIGTEVAARYRAVEPSTQRTFIIATTAHSSDFNREACLKAGMDAFISKPITPGKIAAALRDLGGSLRASGSVDFATQALPPQTKEIDLEMLSFLASETEEGLAGQVDRFLESFDSDRVAARAIIDEGDAEQMHRIAHRLLSHCSVVKYDALSRIALEIQRTSATAKHEKLKSLFDQFEAEFVDFRYKLESIRASTGPA